MKIYYKNYLKDYSRKLRNNSTLSEILLWNELKGRRMLGYQFMRQKPIKKYIVDFFCSKLKLIIEIDGESHHFNEENDIKRQRELEQIGLSFLRFDDLDVKFKIEEVLDTIKKWITQNEITPSPPLLRGTIR
ncbi:MAG TPA: endonuclease domain-containing protein [Ignavibacteriaceae bacterium]|nr:endonuclease domain-containing protein [Ignavibacteriaceae bacterium]